VKDNRLSGIALILGAIASVATMVFHPTHFNAIASAEAITHQVRVLLAVHAFALLTVPTVVFGFVGLTRFIGWELPWSLFAFIAYCLSAIAIMFAGIADGLINAALIQKMLSADEATRGFLRAALEYNFQLNQACAKVFVFGTSLAIISWSIAIVRIGAFERAIGMAGFFVGVAQLAVLLSGRVRLDVHGFGLIILLQATWIVTVGVSMLQTEPQPQAPVIAQVG
jgi:hypothetical protein